MSYVKDKDLREYLEHNLPLHMYSKLIYELIDGRLPDILLCEDSFWVRMRILIKNLEEEEKRMEIIKSEQEAFIDNYNIGFWLMRDVYKGKKEIKHISFTEEQLKRCMNDLGITDYEVHSVSQSDYTKKQYLVAGVIEVK